MDPQPNTSGSEELEKRAEQSLWPGSQNYCYFDEPSSYPLFITKTEGPHVWDADGNKYIDLFLGSGPVILGHDVDYEVEIEPDLTTNRSVSLRNNIEVLLAEKIKELMPFAGRIAYFKTGSEALHFTIREILRESDSTDILTVGYHGWLPPWGGDSLTGNEITLITPEEEPASVLQAIEEHGEHLAAVVLEPTFGLLDYDFFEEVERLTKKYDIDLVMDEVKSGFRLDFPCLSVEADISPEFLIVSKAVGNGAPISIVSANHTVCEEYDLQGVHSTFAAEADALADAYRTVRALEEGAYSEYEEVATRFFELLQGSSGDDEQTVKGRPTFFALNHDSIDMAAVADSLLNDGVLIHPHDQLMFSAAHNQPDVISEITSALRNCTALDT